MAQQRGTTSPTVLSAPSKVFLNPGIFLSQIPGVPGSLCRAVKVFLVLPTPLSENLSASKCVFFSLKLQFDRLFVRAGAWALEALGQPGQELGERLTEGCPSGKGHSSPAEGTDARRPSARNLLAVRSNPCSIILPVPEPYGNSKWLKGHGMKA